MRQERHLEIFQLDFFRVVWTLLFRFSIFASVMDRRTAYASSAEIGGHDDGVFSGGIVGDGFVSVA
jgi:hypothetical protein